MKEAQIKGARHKEDVNESINFINEEIEPDRKEKKKQILEVKQVKTLRKR